MWNISLAFKKKKKEEKNQGKQEIIHKMFDVTEKYFELGHLRLSVMFLGQTS